MTEKRLNIAAVSSYGTVSFIGQRYRVVILYVDVKDLREKLSTFLRTQVMMATSYPDFMDELEYVDINEGFEEVNSELEDMFGNQIGFDNRLVASILPILTDYHIELLGPVTDELQWLRESNEVGILASSTDEGCCGEGEFLEVIKFINPDRKKTFTDSTTEATEGNVANSADEISEVPVLA